MKLPKIPKFFALKPRRKLHASATARRAQPVPDHYEDDEPHTRLSSAFVVVLILHVVAVGGIYAFNSIRSHRKTPEAPVPATVAVKPSAATSTAVAAPSTRGDLPAATAPLTTTSLPSLPSPGATAGRTHRVVAGENLTKIAQQHNVTVAELEAANGPKNVATLRIGQVLTIPKGNAATRVEPAPKVSAAGSAPKGTKSYVVASGDSAVAIAKKFGVSSAELLKLNNIEDPKKLQIGQRLKVPAKKTN